LPACDSSRDKQKNSIFGSAETNVPEYRQVNGSRQGKKRLGYSPAQAAILAAYSDFWPV
jgi:hypothetical protein